MDLHEKRHQKDLEKLVVRLLDKNYDAVLMNPVYHVDNLVGELDVVAIRGDNCHVYEHKTTHGKCQYHKAREQLRRVEKAFPQWEVKLIYHTSDGIMRRIR